MPALLALLAPVFAVADTNVPVVTKLSGSLTVRPSGGFSHDVKLLQPLRSGDVVITGANSSSMLSLSGVADIHLGSGTVVQIFTPRGGLSLKLTAGTMCVDATSAISIVTAGLKIHPTHYPASFDAGVDSSGTKVAAGNGVLAADAGGVTATLHSGDGFIASAKGSGRLAAISELGKAFVECPTAIAQATPTPQPAAAPSPSSGGGGGGGGGFIGVLLGLLAVGAAAGHGGGGGGGSAPPPPTPGPSPGTLGANPLSLTFTSSTSSGQSVQVTESNYSGALSSSVVDGTVASVTPASANGPSASFTVSPVAPGVTKVNFTDNHGGKAQVAITVEGALKVNPTSLSFSLGGDTSQGFLASEINYSGAINAKSEDVTVATVTPASGGGPTQTFSVAAVGPGNTTIDVTDDHGSKATVSVSVSSPGDLNVNPGSLTMLANGSAKTFNVSESNYSGQLKAQSSDANVATVSPSSGNGPGPVTFTVTPLKAGSPQINVTDDHGGSRSVALNITGPLGANPDALTFNGTNSPQTFTASDPNYSGTISASVTAGASVASVTPSGTGPSAQFTVTPLGQGNATITLTDVNGGSTTISVSVSTGGLSVNPTTLSVLAGNQQTFDVSEANYGGKFFASSSNSGQATVTPANANGPGPDKFTVTGVNAGNPNIVVTDNQGGTQFVSVTVTGPLSANPTSLNFDGSSTAAQTFTASDPNFSGAIGASSTNQSVATVSPASANGPSATFSVTAQAAGSATINLSDPQGGSAAVNVTVHAGAFGVNPNSLTFASASAPAQSFTATENFYSGPFTLNANACAGIANVSPQNAGGPSAQYTVTPAGGGSCSLSLTDNHGGSQTVSVTVEGSLSVQPSSLSFSDVGSGNAQTFTASEPGYSGLLTQSTTCGASANVTPASGTAPVTFTVTPVAGTSASGCTVTVSDDHGGSGNVSVVIGPFGTVSPNPNTFTFSDVGSANAATMSVSETGYGGAFTVDASSCSGAVTVSPTTAATSFTVTPQNGTSSTGCTLVVSDDHSQSANVSAIVGPFGAVTPSQTSFTFTGSGQTGQFTVSESGYTGNFTAADSSANPCSGPGIATISPGSGGAGTTFTITSGSNAGNCAFTISDDHGQSSDVAVVSTAGALSVSKSTVQFNDISTSPPPVTVTITDPNNTGGNRNRRDPNIKYHIDDSHANIASVTCASPCEGVSAQITITPLANGQTTINIRDGAGGAGAVSVGVGEAPLRQKNSRHKPAIGKTPHGKPVKPRTPPPSSTPGTPSSSPKPGAPPSGPQGAPAGSLVLSSASITLTRAGDTLSITAIDTAPDASMLVAPADPRIATAVVTPAGAGRWTIAITARAAGMTTIVLTDGRGNRQTIGVRVLAPAPLRTPRPGLP